MLSIVKGTCLVSHKTGDAGSIDEGGTPKVTPTMEGRPDSRSRPAHHQNVSYAEGVPGGSALVLFFFFFWF